MANQVTARYSKKASDLSSRSMKKPPPYISRGSFGVIYSCDGLRIQPESYVQIGPDGMGNAVKIGGQLSHSFSPTRDLFVYLNVSLINGSISAATVNGGTSWWPNYPQSRLFAGPRKPEYQTNYYFPIAYAGGIYSDRGQIITTCVGGSNNAICLERFMRGDIVLYYGCDGFIAQAAASNRA